MHYVKTVNTVCYVPSNHLSKHTWATQNEQCSCHDFEGPSRWHFVITKKAHCSLRGYANAALAAVGGVSSGQGVDAPPHFKQGVFLLRHTVS